jgi:RNA polymerase sigma-70 factor (ECF subfamily)
MTPYADVTDLVAIDEVLKGNREMFEVLVRRYNQRLYRVGLACLQHQQRVEDAMQNTYLKAFLHLSRFRRDASFGTWLTRIMINECRMLRRSLTTRREDEWSEPLGEVVPDATVPPAGQNLTLNEMKSALEDAIAALPAKYRRVYMLREVQQLSTSETAGSLGISAESVKVTLHRAREQLKARLLKTASASELFAYRAPRCDPMTARVMAAVLAVSAA